jgi:hypothetical protein
MGKKQVTGSLNPESLPAQLDKDSKLRTDNRSVVKVDQLKGLISWSQNGSGVELEILSGFKGALKTSGV